MGHRPKKKSFRWAIGTSGHPSTRGVTVRDLLTSLEEDTLMRKLAGLITPRDKRIQDGTATEADFPVDDNPESTSTESLVVGGGHSDDSGGERGGSSGDSERGSS